MSQSEPSIESVADVRTARIVLAVLAGLWAVLAVWMLSDGERLLGAATGRAPGARVVASGALPADGAASVADASVVDDASGVVERAVDAVDADGPTGGAPDAEARREPDAETSGDGSSDGGAIEIAARDGAVSGRAEPSAGVGEPDATRPDEVRAVADVPFEPGGPSEPSEPSEPTVTADEVAVSGDDASSGTDAVVEDVDTAESVFEARRREEIDTLPNLLGQLRFEPLGSEPLATSREPLERAFEILFLYPGTRLELLVESRETDDPASDRDLARRRGGAVVDYLVSRGIERERLSAETGEGGGLPFGEHRVRVTVEDVDR